MSHDRSVMEKVRYTGRNRSTIEEVQFMGQNSRAIAVEQGGVDIVAITKFLVYSIFGVFLFFIPITINGVNSIPLDHLLTYIDKAAPIVPPVFTAFIIIIGGVLPWTDGTWRKDFVSFIISVFRTLGIPVMVVALLDYWKIFSLYPEWLTKPDMLPFLWQKVVMAVTMIVPIGSLFLTFIICFGLLEFIGVMVRPIMKPIYRTPGKSAIDAVASFAGSFSVAIFLTNRLYNESKYTKREAIIIMSGFSTVSATFMIIVAKTAKLMDHWNFYFWSTLVITFLVTAITVRIWPIIKIENKYLDGVGKPERDNRGNILVNAFKEGVAAAKDSGNILQAAKENLTGGFNMIYVLSPIMASVGLLAFVLVKMTSVFDIVGLIFFPFTYLLSLFGMPEPMMLAKACAVILGEMFVPNLLVAGLPMAVKYVVAVTSVSAILFFAGSIPCLLATDVEFKPWQMLVIWFERVALSIIIAGIVALIMFPVQ